MKQDETCNGWTNYETWLLALNIDSDQGCQQIFSEFFRSYGTWMQSRDDFWTYCQDLGLVNEDYQTMKIYDTFHERDIRDRVDFEELWQSFQEED